jgi:hypothetical protein
MVRTAPVRPGRSFRDRDWIIVIECKADSALIELNREQVATTALARRGDGDVALAQAVRRLIDRRQALVPEGEPPYQPRIRFVVRPEGLRTYYLAYPALEALKLPMTCQNFEPEEEHNK